MKIIDQQKINNIGELSRGLRKLADDIDAGKFGKASGVAWIITRGDGDIEFGHLGLLQSPRTQTYFLFGRAMRLLEDIS